MRGGSDEDANLRSTHRWCNRRRPRRVGPTGPSRPAAVNRRNTYEVHLYLPETMREPLKQLAEREDRSVTKLVELILKRAIEERWSAATEDATA